MLTTTQQPTTLAKTHSYRRIALVGLLLILTIATLVTWQPARAADPVIYSHKKHGAVKGADVVAYFTLAPGEKAVIGSDEFTHQWQGATWKFSSAANLEKFKANPEAYAPQFGGYCAFAVSHNFTKPIAPNAWSIVDGKLYLNLNKRVLRKWNKDRDNAIVRGHQNWPKALKACEQHDNCYGS